MRISKRQLRRIIREYGEPAGWKEEKLSAAIDLEPNNPDRPDEKLQYVSNLDDGKVYRLPTKIAKEIVRLAHPVDRKGHVDENGQWISVNDLLGTSNWEWSGAQGMEYGQMNDQRSAKEKAARAAADPAGVAGEEAADAAFAAAAAAGGDEDVIVSGKVEVEWDLEDTEFEDMPYDQALKAAGLPSVVELPGDLSEYELNDWLSDE